MDNSLPLPARPRSRTVRFDAPVAPSAPNRPAVDGLRQPASPALDAELMAARLAEVRQKLVAANWQNVDLLIRAAGFCRDLGQREEARSMLARAARIDRNNTYARGKLAEICTPDEICDLDLPAPSQSLRKDFWEPFRYALRGNGRIMIGVGAAFFGAIQVAAELLGSFGIIGGAVSLVLMLLVLSYLLAYLRAIIQSTATDAKEAPDWPDLHDDLVPNCLKMLVLFGLVMAPALIWDGWIAPDLGGAWTASLGHAALIVPGMCALPMMMLLFCVSNRLLSALNPAHIGRGIFRAGGDYWLAVVIWWAAELGRNLLSSLLGGVPLVGTILAMAIWLYFMLVGGRAVGLVYQAKRERLGWYQ